MLKKKMLLPVIALGIMLTIALSGEANAQYGFGWGGGQGHIGVYPPATRPHWGQGRRSYLPNWRPPVFHDTTHLDYHPPQAIRHGCNSHIQPGHYDAHRSGHWHR